MTRFRIVTIVLVSLILCPALSAEVHAREYEYDEAGRIVKVTYDNGRTISYAYDEGGNASGGEVVGADTGPDDTPRVDGDASGSDDGGCATATGARTRPSDSMWWLVGFFVLARMR